MNNVTSLEYKDPQPTTTITQHITTKGLNAIHIVYRARVVKTMCALVSCDVDRWCQSIASSLISIVIIWIDYDRVDYFEIETDKIPPSLKHALRNLKIGHFNKSYFRRSSSPQIKNVVHLIQVPIPKILRIIELNSWRIISVMLWAFLRLWIVII